MRGFGIPIMLEGLSILIYGSLGYLIRYLQQTNLINSAKLPIKNYEKDPIQYILRDLLVNFNLGWINLAMVGSFATFALLDYAYYKKGHPKKNIIYEHMIGNDLETLSREMEHQDEV